MITNEIGQKLHNKAVMGDELKPREQAQLQEWYDFLDGEETALLKLNVRNSEIDELKNQIIKNKEGVLVTTAKIQQKMDEIEALKYDIEVDWKNLVENDREERMNATIYRVMK
ncbi:MAG: hypothetical protein HUU38_00135 [Anaerolineales bacterium]|nr:hypothetical protein [Anaerolineales bacterium]